MSESWRDQPITKGKLHDTIIFASTVFKVNMLAARNVLTSYRGLGNMVRLFELGEKVVVDTLDATAKYLSQEE